MPELVTTIRIFVASLGEVSEERDAFAEVVDNLQQGIGDAHQLALRLVRWETDIDPELGPPHEVINNQV